MRETRLSGSEGGRAVTRPPYLYPSWFETPMRVRSLEVEATHELSQSLNALNRVQVKKVADREGLWWFRRPWEG